ncbi:response regulator transcription factor [bacterium SCSIO 12741]|nr:response regulator transcription factor [bacterium SCSIO 12741]
MQILIIEDEKPASRRLERMIKSHRPNWKVLDVLDTVEDSVNWFRNMSLPDLVFMDIQLADGISFNIFEQVSMTCPVIFTTAYDHYAIQAFKVNSIDYLLKPIDEAELQQAITKFEQRSQGDSMKQMDWMKLVQQSIKENPYKERFLVRLGDQLKYIPVDQIALFYSEQSTPYLVDFDGRKSLIDYPLDQLTEMLDPKEYFRVSRKLIVHHRSISKIHTWFNGRLKLSLKPAAPFETLVSRDRVNAFKAWLDQ